MAQHNTTQILLVVNELTQRELADILDGAFSFDAAKSVDEAKAFLGRNGYEAAIVDEDLPNEGRQSVVEFLREQEIRIPVLICTGEVGGKSLFAESKRDDTFISDVLVRPFSPAVVRARIESALYSSPHEKHHGATLPSHPLE